MDRVRSVLCLLWVLFCGVASVHLKQSSASSRRTNGKQIVINIQPRPVLVPVSRRIVPRRPAPSVSSSNTNLKQTIIVAHAVNLVPPGALQPSHTPQTSGKRPINGGNSGHNGAGQRPNNQASGGNGHPANNRHGNSANLGHRSNENRFSNPNGLPGRQRVNGGQGHGGPFHGNVGNLGNGGHGNNGSPLNGNGWHSNNGGRGNSRHFNGNGGVHGNGLSPNAHTNANNGWRTFGNNPGNNGFNNGNARSSSRRGLNNGNGHGPFNGNGGAFNRNNGNGSPLSENRQFNGNGGHGNGGNQNSAGTGGLSNRNGTPFNGNNRHFNGNGGNQNRNGNHGNNWPIFNKNGRNAVQSNNGAHRQAATSSGLMRAIAHMLGQAAASMHARKIASQQNWQGSQQNKPSHGPSSRNGKLTISMGGPSGAAKITIDTSARQTKSKQARILLVPKDAKPVLVQTEGAVKVSRIRGADGRTKFLIDPNPTGLNVHHSDIARNVIRRPAKLTTVNPVPTEEPVEVELPEIEPGSPTVRPSGRPSSKPNRTTF